MSPRRGSKQPEPEQAEPDHEESALDGDGEVGGGGGESGDDGEIGGIGEIEEGDPTRKIVDSEEGEEADGEDVDDELARAGDDEDDIGGDGEDEDEAAGDQPGVVAPDAKREVKGFLEALIEKGALILVEGAKVDRLVPDVLKALATKDRRRAALFLDALIDHDDVDEVFLDEDQVVKLLAAWF